MEQQQSKFLTRLRSMPLGDRITAISVITVSLGIIALVIAQFFLQWEYGMHAIELLSGIVMLLQCRLYWKSNRFTAIFSLCAAGIILVCFAVLCFAK